MAKRAKPDFVPEAEQPYKIPHNWRWVNVGQVSTLYRGVSYKKEDAHTVKGEHDILILRGGNIGEGYIDTHTDNVYVNNALVSQHQIVCKHDIVIIGSTGSKTVIGRAGIALENYSDVAFGAFLLLIRPAKAINPQYLDYYFLTDDYRNRVKNLSKGININNVRADYITQSPIPFPPLAEQQRIVERIESLFAKLDAARDNAQAVVDGFETRKAAILYRAFNGELTAQWRKHNGISLNQWFKRALGDCGTWSGGGTPSMKHPEYWRHGDLPWITPKDMKSDVIEDSAIRVNMSGVQHSSANYITTPSVLFVVRSGILRHTFPVAMVKRPFTVNQDLKALSPHDMDLNYLFWACKSCEKKILEACMKNGTTVESINTRALMAFQIPIAPEKEQKEITRCVEALLSREKTVKASAETVIAQIDAMKKAILGRAFRGELGTNDPSEASPEHTIIGG